MTGAATAFALTSLELLAGTFLVMLAGVVIWPAISRGHWRATTWVLFPLVAATALVLPSSIRTFTLAVAAGMLAFLLGVYSQRPLLEWITGGVAGALTASLLITAGLNSCPETCVVGPAHLLAGALFLGSATHGMALGHWYLNQPRLPLEPLLASTHMILIATVAPFAIGLITRPELVAASIPLGILMVSASGYWWAWVVLLVSLIPLALMIRSTVKSRSTQSATGLLYVAMIPAIGAQFLLTLLFLS